MVVLITVTAATTTTTTDDDDYVDDNNVGTISNRQHDMTVVLTQSLQYLQPQAIKNS
jgi:hypothetical protein